MASLARVEIDLDRPILKLTEKWFGDTRASLGSLRRTIEDLEERIASTDAFVGPCEKALADGQRALARAERCLRTAPLRAGTATSAQSPPGQGQSAAGGGAKPPSAPPAQPSSPSPNPAATPPRPAPSAPPAAPAIPSVEQNVHGGIKIQGGAKRIPVGQSVTFTATDIGNRPYRDVVWNSHDEELLSLGQDGRATGLKPGKLTIQAKTADDPYSIAYFEVEVVAAAPGPGARPSDPATGPAKPGPSAWGAAPAGPARPGTAQGSGGFGDRGLVVGPDKEKETGEKEKGEGVSLLGQAAGSIGPPEKAKPAGGDAGFGDKGLETGRRGETAAPAAGAAGATGPGRKPDPSSGTGGRQSGSGPAPSLRPLSFQGGAQPAAWHIFATGSRLGWASAHARFSDAPADQDIVDHLVMAGEHAMWANRESYEPYRAWPNWSEIKVRLRTWAEEIIRDTAPERPRERLSRSIASYASSMAEQITFQALGDRVKMPNCDGAYMRLGFHVGFGHTALQLAEGAARAGRPETGERVRREAVEQLRQAVRILREYERTGVVTGVCADLKDVRAEVEALLNRADAAAQAVAAGNAWTTASERIRALAGLTARARPEPKPDPRPGTGTTIPAAPPSPPPSASAGELWADPGELEGTWVTTLARYRFERSGNDYIGKLERIFSPTGQSFEDAPNLHLARQGYREGDVVFRGTRTGPNSYRGAFQDRLALRRSREDPIKLVDRAEIVEAAVLGDHLDIRSADVSTETGTSYYEVWERAIREGGVEKLPADFGELNEHMRSSFFMVNEPIWMCASRRGSDGRDRLVVFQDISQFVSRGYSRLPSLLTSSDPAFKPLQDYFQSCSGLRRRLEEAGYTITLGPTSLPSCMQRMKPRW